VREHLLRGSATSNEEPDSHLLDFVKVTKGIPCDARES